MKLLRTIQLDPSDTFVFKRAAEPGEWAVSGAFVFAGADAAALQGKSRAAFRSGFLGIDSLGWSTLAQVVDASVEDRAAAVELLTRRLVEHFGAPDTDAARAAAEEEVAFAAALCKDAKGTVIAVSRSAEDGAIRETFRTLQPRGGPRPQHAYAFLEVEGEDEAPAEEIDLKTLVRGERR
jgi:uncharacterized protein DUF6505